MTSRLPPLAAVRAFEAAARHGSVTRAAEELGMTQAAVSYQIKVLEERIGAPLFLRKPRRIELTDLGRQFAPAVTQAFELLGAAYAAARGGARGTLVVSTLPTLAANWLARRLGRFQAAHPDLIVRIETS
ncbi:LysR family transcriptional regulator, partial [Inquilinus sp. CA228]|uniref:LysR family transcriptional regulator n=1 Tax=Inquilinus sp. CA228 TaxID=3455609 RepID=UPI003F8D30AC